MVLWLPHLNLTYNYLLHLCTHTAEGKEEDIFLIGTASGRQIPGRDIPDIGLVCSFFNAR